MVYILTFIGSPEDCWPPPQSVNTMEVDSQADSTLSRASASRWSMVRPYLIGVYFQLEGRLLHNLKILLYQNNAIDKEFEAWIFRKGGPVKQVVFVMNHLGNLDHFSGREFCG